MAVFVTHGMGQQIPFSTQDQVADKLLEVDGYRNPDLTVCAVRFAGEQWLRRVEMELGDQRVSVHLYEGYWAPLTEGKVSLRQVIGFLFGAARNGMKNGRDSFCRWMFGEYRDFKPLGRSVLYLLLASSALASLLVVDATIGLVTGALSILEEPPAWFNDNLREDLQTVMDFVVTCVIAAGFLWFVSRFLRRSEGKAAARARFALTVIPFAVLLIVLIVAAAALLTVLFMHLKLDVDKPVWARFLPFLDERFSPFVDKWVFWVAVFFGAVLVLRNLRFLGRMVIEDVARGEGVGWRPRIATVAVAVPLVGAAGLSLWTIYRILGSVPGTLPFDPSSVLWLALLVVSLAVRNVLVQFVGDVAIYVSPYKLDEFYDLREAIKDRIFKAALAIYDHRRADDPSKYQYEKVLIAGHSLGSVIAYDVLNQLVRNDQADNDALGVVKRTPLFLTFGSPLDKTAFLFAVQHNLKGPREALASAGQPLIQDYRYRPARWVNVYSPWDIVSGPLDLYDAEPTAGQGPAGREVCNKKDPLASTFLKAHVEYWDNRLVYEELLESILSVPDA